MSLTMKQLLVRAGTLAGVGLVGASLAWGQAAPPEPPNVSDTGGRDATTSEGETPDATRPGVSAAKTPRLGNTGDAAIPGTTRLRPAESTRPTRTTTSRGFAPQGGEDDDEGATNDAPGATRRTTRDPDDSDRNDTDARETADDFRDAARETARDARESTEDAADDFRNSARESRRDAREAADDFRDAARDAAGDDRDADRETGRGDVESRTAADFQVDSVRSADVGLWFDRSTDDGLVINDIGTGLVSRWGLREGDRIYSVNGMRVDNEREFVSTLFNPRWRDQRTNVIIYRHGRPWTVYMHPSQLVTEYTTVAANDPLEDYGLILDDRYDDYVVVWRVNPRSPAYYAGLRPGDVITTFDGRRLSGRDDFVRWMGQGNLDSAALEINRNRQLRRIDFDLSRAGIRTGARTSLRPNLDASGRFDGNLDGRIDGDARLDGDAGLDGRIDGRFDSRTDGRLDTRTDGRIDSRIDAGVQGATTGRATGGAIPNRLRGSAAGGVDADADFRGTVQPGVRGSGTVQPGFQGGGTAQPGAQGGTRAGVQGGARSGGLFRGNR